MVDYFSRPDKIYYYNPYCHFFNQDQIQNLNTDRYIMNRAIFDEKGELWIASEKNGLLYFNPKSNSFTNYRHDQGKIPSATIHHYH